jgi:hypothetical protein
MDSAANPSRGETTMTNAANQNTEATMTKGKKFVFHTHLLVGRESTHCGARAGFSTVTDLAKVTCPKCKKARPKQEG